MTTPKSPTPTTPPLRPASEDTKENVVEQEAGKGKVRPDGPGDETAPVPPETPKD